MHSFLRRFSFLLAALTIFGSLESSRVIAYQAPAANTPVAQEKTGLPEADVEPAKPAGPKSKGFFEILFSGGPLGVAIMLGLIGLSLAAAYLVFDNVLTLRQTELMPAGLADEIRKSLAAASLAQAEASCKSSPSLLGYVALRGLAEAEGGWSEIEKALEEGLAEQAARLFRKVEYLSVIGNLAPMLGLLGTVTGMLLAFQEVAISQGAAGAAELAEGIYQALVTTVVGLIIAIPALGAFAILRNRVDQIAAEAAYQLQHAFAPLKRRAVAASSPGPLPPPPPPAARKG